MNTKHVIFVWEGEEPTPEQLVAALKKYYDEKAKSDLDLLKYAGYAQ